MHRPTNVGWLKCRIIARPTGALRVTEFPTGMTKEQYTAIGRKQRSAKRQKLPQKSSKTKDVPRRMFSLRLSPTKEQKRYFQRAFGIACLAKRLAYKHLGDQSLPLSSERMQELRTQICTEKVTVRVYPEPIPEGKKPPRKGYKEVKRTNDFLPLKFRERLFETKLSQLNKEARASFEGSREKGKKRIKSRWTVPLHHQTIPSDVRNNAVIQFCQAVNVTQGQVAERAHIWDTKMASHQCWLRQQQAVADEEALVEMTGERITKRNTRKRALDAIPEREKKRSVSKYPPRGERPTMGAHQVKATDRNSSLQTIRIDARSGNANEYTASWFAGDDAVKLRTGNMNVALWGSPSHRHRELQRLSARMHEGERGTRQQITIKYDHGRYYLQVQCLLSADLKLRPLLPTEPVRAVALDPGVRTMFGMYDSSWGVSGTSATARSSTSSAWPRRPTASSHTSLPTSRDPRTSASATRPSDACSRRMPSVETSRTTRTGRRHGRCAITTTTS
jgi:hypothetical protein